MVISHWSYEDIITSYCPKRKNLKGSIWQILLWVRHILEVSSLPSRHVFVRESRIRPSPSLTCKRSPLHIFTWIRKGNKLLAFQNIVQLDLHCTDKAERSFLLCATPKLFLPVHNDFGSSMLFFFWDSAVNFYLP